MCTDIRSLFNPAVVDQNDGRGETGRPPAKSRSIEGELGANRSGEEGA